MILYFHSITISTDLASLEAELLPPVQSFPKHSSFFLAKDLFWFPSVVSDTTLRH